MLEKESHFAPPRSDAGGDILTSRDQKGSSTRRDQCIVNGGKAPKASSSSSRPWQLTKDPRIVRVARSFGGKDRHSKVYTVRGLRDRRVRLSVQTAIQLYDLQDRLGLNQPSKVVDWLLEAAQRDIDKLPPLQMPIENLVQFGQPMLVPQEMTTPSFGGSHPFALASVKTMQNNDTENGACHQAADHQHELLRTSTRSSYNIWSSDHGQLMKDKSKLTLGKETNWLKIQENQEGSSNAVNQGYHIKPGQTTIATSFMNNVHVPYASYYHWEPPSRTYGVGLPSQQTEDHHNSSTTMPSNSGSQLLFYPSGMRPPMLPSYVSSPSVDQLDSKHMINHVQMLNPNSQNLLPSTPIATSHVYSICTPSMIPFQVSIASRQKQQLPANDHGTRTVVESQRSDNHVSPVALTVPGSSFRENPKADAGSNPPSFLSARVPSVDRIFDT